MSKVANEMADKLREIWNNHDNVTGDIIVTASKIEAVGEFGEDERMTLAEISAQCLSLHNEIEKILQGGVA